MDALEQREAAFEKRFAMQEEFRFRALARRNRALGLWAASLIGYDGAEAGACASVLVEEQVDGADDEALAKALVAEFTSANVDMSERRILQKMAVALARAEIELDEDR